MGVSELLLIRHGESEGNLAAAEARAAHPWTGDLARERHRRRAISQPDPLSREVSSPANVTGNESVYEPESTQRGDVLTSQSAIGRVHAALCLPVLSDRSRRV